MKAICLLALILCALFLGACDDVPLYEPGAVATVANSISPDCQAPAEKCG